MILKLIKPVKGQSPVIITKNPRLAFLQVGDLTVI